MLLRYYVVFSLMTVINSPNINNLSLRVYFLYKDFFNGMKSAACSVYTFSNKTKLFRIGSKYGFTPKFDLIAYPSKKIVGKFESTGTGEIAGFNSKSTSKFRGSNLKSEQVASNNCHNF